METTPPDANITNAPTNIDTQNVKFLDQKPSYTYDVDSTMDPTRTLQDTNDATLDNFFSRPIKIHEAEWGTGTQLAFDIDPWALYFNNKRVINRICNYKLLRANLRVKVVINGNGFQYGRALCSYLPLNGFDDLSTNAALITEDLVQASQQPHIYLDPTTSTGGELLLPFFWYANYVDIISQQYTALGQLYFRSMNDLKHANGATDQVTVSVFAWAEDISFNVLTSVSPSSLVPQSGYDEIDEANDKGIVSGTATKIAKISNAMTAIPPIAPFAMATTEIANGVASLARSLGFSRPPVTKNPEPRRSFPTSSLAITTVPDTTQKLTVDDKQELTIDPRIAGLGSADPMSIRDIAKKESFLTKFSWNIGTAPETLLWNGRVSPVTWAENAGPPKSYHMPACCMAAMPFKFWTGTMNFRFQIVCSAFHKGRLKIVYDPNYIIGNEYNVNYLEIVDIADKQDFTISVGNGQTRTLLRHHAPGIDSSTQLHSTTRYTNEEEGNGVLGVFVVNELTTPNSTVNNDIEVNVFVSAGDDFEVFVPDDHFQRFVFKPQSGVDDFLPVHPVVYNEQSGVEPTIVSDSQNTEEPSAPQQTMRDRIGPDYHDTALTNLVFTGECITSFRQMLKRYNHHERIYYSRGVTPALAFKYAGYRNAFPYLRGAVQGAVHTADSGGVPFAYSYCNTVLMHWVVGAFQGWRGSVRRKILFNRLHNPGTSISSDIYVERQGALSSGATYFDAISAETAPASLSSGAYEKVANDNISTGTIESRQTGSKGVIYANTLVNPTVEFESPYYTDLRFSPGKEQNYTTGLQFAEGYSMVIRGISGGMQSYDSYVAAGEDFQVYFWTGMPRLYYESSPPAP